MKLEIVKDELGHFHLLVDQVQCVADMTPDEVVALSAECHRAVAPGAQDDEKKFQARILASARVQTADDVRRGR